MPFQPSILESDRLDRLVAQFAGRNPFGGDIVPGRVSLLRGGARRTLPFPHPGNYRYPLEILESYFVDADGEPFDARHNRYLSLPGFAPVLVSRDPAIIRAILTATGDGPSDLDRDTLPSTGIARATGTDTLLYSNGDHWRHQRKLSASPFGKTSLFQPERFDRFEGALRATIRERVRLLRERLWRSGQPVHVLAIEPELKTIMLELLVNCFFGAELSSNELREKYVPAIERLIDHIVRDTVVNRLGLPLWLTSQFSWRARQARADMAVFDQLTDLVLVGRHEGRGLWPQFRSDAPDIALKSNLRVFLAGALEATTSFATWAIMHLARNPADRTQATREVDQIDVFTPDAVKRAPFLHDVLEETLRLTPALYFMPRRAKSDTRLTTAQGRSLVLPARTHVLLDVWHANRHEDHWGEAMSGFPADRFVPQRWRWMEEQRRGSKDSLHFGFGHGPRICPGKHLGELEVSLVVGAFLKLFDFEAVHHDGGVKAGVTTKPADGGLVRLRLRDSVPMTI